MRIWVSVFLEDNKEEQDSSKVEFSEDEEMLISRMFNLVGERFVVVLLSHHFQVEGNIFFVFIHIYA